MAGLESLAMGVPVLAADNRGTREYMSFGKNGLLYPWDDPAGFARGIALLRGMDPAGGSCSPSGAWPRWRPLTGPAPRR